jgi:predicted RNase H-like nuclease (RuvC/YqgF family)
MSEESRRQEYTPLNLHPFVGLDLGERWGREVGELSQRLTNVDQAVARLEHKTDALDAKIDAVETKLEAKIEAVAAKVDAMAHTVARHDERFNSLERRLDSHTRMLWGMFTAILAAIIIQKFI